VRYAITSVVRVVPSIALAGCDDRMVTVNGPAVMSLAGRSRSPTPLWATREYENCVMSLGG
jgi:hypothetical protein